MSTLISPHGGGALQPLQLSGAAHSSALTRAAGLTKVPLSSREMSDLFMLAMGAYTPLEGFMDEADWHQVCEAMTTKNGVLWPVPITLSCAEDLANKISIGDEIALTDRDSGETLAIQQVTDKYTIDRQFECQHVFGTTDKHHPGVQKVMEQSTINLAGPISALSEGHYPDTYQGLYLRPEETRAIFEKLGWSKIAAFQTRNPMHRSHEYLAKIAIEICDGLLIHQVLGNLKPGDIPATIRVKAIDILVQQYFTPETVLQAGCPIEMRYAGPREALLHAIFRQNFGCTHLVIGRDHAGVGSYYGPYDAQRIFDSLPPGSLRIQPLKIDVAFFCYRCNNMATNKSCPHEEEDRLAISGTRLREMFSRREVIPEEFTRPEVAAALQEYYSDAH